MLKLETHSIQMIALCTIVIGSIFLGYLEFKRLHYKLDSISEQVKTIEDLNTIKQSEQLNKEINNHSIGENEKLSNIVENIFNNDNKPIDMEPINNLANNIDNQHNHESQDNHRENDLNDRENNSDEDDLNDRENNSDEDDLNGGENNSDGDDLNGDNLNGDDLNDDDLNDHDLNDRENNSDDDDLNDRENNSDGEDLNDNNDEYNNLDEDTLIKLDNMDFLNDDIDDNKIDNDNTENRNFNIEYTLNSELYSKTLKELKGILKERNLPKSGNKNDCIQRIINDMQNNNNN